VGAEIVRDQNGSRAAKRGQRNGGTDLEGRGRGCAHDCEWCDSLSGGATFVAGRQLKHLLFCATSFTETEKLAERNGLRPENCSYCTVTELLQGMLRGPDGL